MGQSRYSQNYDNATAALNTITHEHAGIHGGDRFVVTKSDSDLDAGEVIKLLVTTPNTARYCHMNVKARAAGQASLHIYEDTAYVASDGAAMTPRNRDRNSATAATTTINGNPVAGVIGSDIYCALLGGGDTIDDTQIVLDANVKYLMLLTSRAANNVTSLVLNWCEHTNLQ